MNNQNALVIIGNGFDLQLGLNSSYDSFLKKINNNNNVFNVWPTIIKSNINSGEILWKDIEYSILNFLTDNRNNIVNFYNAINIDPDREFEVDYTPFLKDNIKIGRILGVNLKNFKTYSKDNFHTQVDNKYYDKIMNQINELESLFNDYMNTQLVNSNYKDRALTLLKEIITANDPDKTNNYSEIQILNFNYTSIFNSNESESKGTTFIERNIHGILSDNNNSKNIIFGIDSTRFNIQDKPFLYQFTKTFRVMNNNIKSEFSNQLAIPKQLNYIYFYGHSLGDQDYSYFQSIFDTIDLYYSETILRFVFSDSFLVTEDQKLKHKVNMSSQVAKLIEIYGESFGQEKLRGKNLLHKLIVENRLEIILLNPNSTKPKE